MSDVGDVPPCPRCGSPRERRVDAPQIVLCTECDKHEIQLYKDMLVREIHGE